MKELQSLKVFLNFLPQSRVDYLLKGEAGTILTRCRDWLPHIKHTFLPSVLILGDKKAVLVISILISLSATLVNRSHFLFALFD